MPSSKAAAIALAAMAVSHANNTSDFHVVLPMTSYTINTTAATTTTTQPASTSKPTVVPALNCPKYELIPQPPSPLLCGVPGVPSGDEIRAFDAVSLDWCVKRCYENPECLMVGFKDWAPPDAKANCYLWGHHSLKEGNPNPQTLYYHIDCFTCNPIRRGPAAGHQPRGAPSHGSRLHEVEDLGGQYKYCGKRRAKRGSHGGGRGDEEPR